MAARMFKAVGAISGTSIDGIDVAVIDTDGEGEVTAGPGRTYPYPPGVRERLLTVVADPNEAERAPLLELDAAVTAAHGDAIGRLQKQRS